jgi:hypothetical protein
MTGHAAQTPEGQCPADWRRPDGYWRCQRVLGHRGRHHLKASTDARLVRIERPDETMVGATQGTSPH